MSVIAGNVCQAGSRENIHFFFIVCIVICQHFEKSTVFCESDFLLKKKNRYLLAMSIGLFIGFK